ncbi:MAG: phosphotransferase family protein [bacterium]|nr:phosphotransferase family protein [bacterium]
MALTVAEYQTEAVESSSTEVPGIDITPVTAWLAANIASSEPPFTFDLIAAGGSNLTFRLADSGGRQWALRRPPVGSALATAHDMGREWRIMAALGEASDVPVPDMVAFCDDHSVNGADFYVMSFVEGLILRDQDSAADMTPEQAEVATQSLLDVQIAFHTLDLDEVGLGDLGRREDYVGRQLKRWRRQVEAAGVREVPLLIELHERLSTAKPAEAAPPALAHGDYRFDNTVLDNQWKIAAVLDWELCTTGNPIADFAWSLQYWADPGDEMSFLTDPPTLMDCFVRRQEVADRYAAQSGFDLSDLPYYAVFSWWKQACIVEGAYARRLQGMTGGMGTTGDVHDIARRVDDMLAHAAGMAVGVL